MDDLRSGCKLSGNGAAVTGNQHPVGKPPQWLVQQRKMRPKQGPASGNWTLPMLPGITEIRERQPMAGCYFAQRRAECGALMQLPMEGGDRHARPSVKAGELHRLS